MARAPFALSPLPERLRLSCRRPFGKPPAPPLGLASWSEEPDAALCILLDLPSSWPGTGLGDPDLVAAQVPEASSLPKGQLIVVLARGAPEKEGLRRLMAKRTWASPTIRATVLLARGYSRIGAGIDAKTRSDLVWGYA